MSNLFLRISSSVIMLPVIIYILFLKNFLFYLTLVILFAFTVYELKFLVKKKILIFLLLLFTLSFFVFSIISLRGEGIIDFYYILWWMSIVWLSDLGGYIFGKIFKGFKFTKISPNKTISGLIGSFFLSQYAFLIIYYSLDISYSYYIFIFQFLVCIISILGDLFFSYLKRKNNIKDFSKIIPGHGGILDRIDGLMPAIIFIYFFRFIYE